MLIKYASRKLAVLGELIARRVRYTRWRLLLGDLGADTVFYGRITVTEPASISIGRKVTLNDGVGLYGRRGSEISIEDYVSISPKVSIVVGRLEIEGKQPPYRHTMASVRVCRGAWIGSHAVILGGVTVGEQSIVAAGSVVTRDVPPGTVVAGAPARVVKQLAQSAATRE